MPIEALLVEVVEEVGELGAGDVGLEGGLEGESLLQELRLPLLLGDVLVQVPAMSRL